MIEKFIRFAYRQRYNGQNMTYEASTFLYAIAVAVFALGGMCGGFVGGWVANKLGRWIFTKNTYDSLTDKMLRCLRNKYVTMSRWCNFTLYCYRKGGLLLNNVVGILGALAMGASKVSELYELLIMGRYLIGVNCGTYKNWVFLDLGRSNT